MNWERVYEKDLQANTETEKVKVPMWVWNILDKVSFYDMVNNNEHLILKGNHFKYKICAYGQGGTSFSIDRTLVHGKGK